MNWTYGQTNAGAVSRTRIAKQFYSTRFYVDGPSLGQAVIGLDVSYHFDAINYLDT
jgi:hypothetical protein